MEHAMNDSMNTPPRGGTVDDLVNKLAETDLTLKRDLGDQRILGAQIARARAKAGYSQRQLAAVSGVRQATITQIETGAGNPRWETVMRLCRALKIDRLDIDAA